MKCLYCGENIGDDSNYCVYCGKPVVGKVQVRVPDLVYDLPAGIKHLLEVDNLNAAIFAYSETYHMSREDAVGFVDMMYYQNLILCGNKLQAIQRFCSTKNSSWEEGDEIMEEIETILKENL